MFVSVSLSVHVRVSASVHVRVPVKTIVFKRYFGLSFHVQNTLQTPAARTVWISVKIGRRIRFLNHFEIILKSFCDRIGRITKEMNQIIADKYCGALQCFRVNISCFGTGGPVLESILSQGVEKSLNPRYTIKCLESK